MKSADFFSSKFLFNPVPSPETKLYIPFLVIFGLMIGIGIVISFQKEENKQILGKFFVPLISCGILGLIALFARHEGLAYLASRFFLALILFIFVIWVVALIAWALKYIPKHLDSQKTEDKFQKYLPKPKRKNN